MRGGGRLRRGYTCGSILVNNFTKLRYNVDFIGLLFPSVHVKNYQNSVEWANVCFMHKHDSLGCIICCNKYSGHKIS